MNTAARGGVVLVSAEPRVSEAVRAAARLLLEETPGDLSGLFVEDPRLLAAASLPFTREIGRHSGVARAFERSDMERLLRGRARAFESEFAALAQALRRPWRFEQCRGDALTRALDALQEATAVILAPAAAGPEARAGGQGVSAIARARNVGALRAADRLAKAVGHPVQTHIIADATVAGDPLAARPESASRDWLLSRAARAAVVVISVSVLPSTASERAEMLRALRGVLVLVPD